MKIGLGAKLGTGLSLTPQLQQAIRLLQLSSLELAQEVQTQLALNPLLELEEDTQVQEVAQSPLEDGTHDSESGVDELLNQTVLSGEIAVDAVWEDTYIHEPTKWDAPTDSGFEVSGKTNDSIQNHMRWQMAMLDLTDMQRYICAQLIDSMDDNGFITTTPEQLVQHIATELVFLDINTTDAANIPTPDDVLVVIKLMQSCEPLGVAAQGLAECLLLQLDALPPSLDTQAATAILAHHELLEKNDIKALVKATNLELDEIKAAMALIRTLEPYPAARFNSDETTYQIPDVLVEIAHEPQQCDPRVPISKQQAPVQSGRTYRVRLNPEVTPRLGINQTYKKLIKRGDSSDEQAYLKTHFNDAKNFIKGVEERNNSLLAVAGAIAKAQVDFFEQGEVAMKPLILRNIADQVGLHESTVSRITTAKYMLTPRGLFELKYFFSSHVGADEGTCSSVAICAMIKAYVEKEDCAKPLSDNKLAQLLQDQGIHVARRTIAKYREQMKIGSSTERKRLL